MGDTSETNTKVLSRELFLGVVALKRLYRKIIICAIRSLFPNPDRLQIYNGNNYVIQDNTGLSSRVVLDLLDSFEYKNLHVYDFIVVLIYFSLLLVQGLLHVDPMVLLAIGNIHSAVLKHNIIQTIVKSRFRPL